MAAEAAAGNHGALAGHEAEVVPVRFLHVHYLDRSQLLLRHVEYDSSRSHILYSRLGDGDDIPGLRRVPT